MLSTCRRRRRVDRKCISTRDAARGGGGRLLWVRFCKRGFGWGAWGGGRGGGSGLGFSSGSSSAVRYHWDGFFLFLLLLMMKIRGDNSVVEMTRLLVRMELLDILLFLFLLFLHHHPHPHNPANQISPISPIPVYPTSDNKEISETTRERFRAKASDLDEKWTLGRQKGLGKKGRFRRISSG